MVIALIGYFNHLRPTSVQLQALEQLIEEGVQLQMVTPDYRLYGLNQFSAQYEGDMGAELYAIVKKSSHWSKELPNVHLAPNQNIIKSKLK